MNILYYNWVQFDDDENRGGGVTVYQRNLIDYMINEGAHLENKITFLSSGLAYNYLRKEIYIEKTKNIYGNKVKSYQVVNSPLFAPGHHSFSKIDTYLYDESLYDKLKKFLESTGPYDIIHFNNLEGLSLKCMELKKVFPDTKFVFSVHNYYPFCPQVNLWYGEKANCLDYENGHRCLNCLKYVPNTKSIYKANCLAYFLRKCGFGSNSIVFSKAFSHTKLIGKIVKRIVSSPQEGPVWKAYAKLTDMDNFCNFRQKNIKSFNENMDAILTVSRRVAEIALEFGVDSKKVVVSYIGTKFADNEIRAKSVDKGRPLNIAYMGYARRDKGFYFLLSALNSLDDSILPKINLFLAVKINDQRVYKLIDKLKGRVNSIYIKDGYKHKELREMLKNIDLGIVPVMWEDNLPQVAIELVANSVPILCSSGGGASELSGSIYFKYKLGDKDDFKSKLSTIVLNPQIINDYWEKSIPLTTMKMHVEELMNIYSGEY